MRRSYLLLGVMTLLLTACGPVSIGGGNSGDGISVDNGKTPGATLSPFITGGQIDSGHPSAGQLSGCTGTLIGKHTVLTAGHCVGSYGYFKVNGQKIYTKRIYRHPSYGGGNRNDVAVMILKQDVQGVTPTPIATQAPTNGMAITLVGFGKTGENKKDYGTKRYTTNVISRVSSSIFSFRGAKNICNGDSGGPTYATYGGQEVVIGVHSTKSGWCGNGGNDMRVDKYVSWIKQKGGSDVVVQGQGGGTPNPNPNPNPSPPQGSATEGQSCYSLPCAQGLACVTVKSGSTVKGKYCMEKCYSKGSTSAPCDGGDVCTNSSQGLICFNKNKSSSGYCTPDAIPPGGTTPDAGVPGGGKSDGGSWKPNPPQSGATEGQSCASQSCVSGLKCVPVKSNGSIVGRYCMERCYTAGSTAAPCDGGDKCTKSTSQGLICFNPKKSASGFCTPDATPPGGGAPTPPGGQTPPGGAPTPPGGGNSKVAYEGMSCATKPCDTKLTCLQVWQGANIAGKYCMEKCTTVGSTSAPCDGAETCTQSPAQGLVCFASNNPQGGYTSNGPGGSKYSPMP